MIQYTYDLVGLPQKSSEILQGHHLIVQVYAIKNFAKDLFPVADQFILALDHVEKMSEEDLNSNQELKDLANGVKMTQGELNKAFDKNKIKLGELKQHYLFPCGI